MLVNIQNYLLVCKPPDHEGHARLEGPRLAERRRPVGNGQTVSSVESISRRNIALQKPLGLSAGPLRALQRTVPLQTYRAETVSMPTALLLAAGQWRCWNGNNDRRHAVHRQHHAQGHH